jgi:hypothetical protein
MIPWWMPPSDSLPDPRPWAQELYPGVLNPRTGSMPYYVPDQAILLQIEDRRRPGAASL